MIIDTDVLIWYMKGNEEAYREIENTNKFFMSVITYIELVQGMRNKEELDSLRKALCLWNAKILYISEDISAKAMFCVEQHFLSHSLQLADALIGATAAVCSLPIFTAYDKHYKAIRGVQLKIFRP